MSQYLNIFLKKKGADISVSLTEFCTTPARQISNLGAFPYTESNVLLTPVSVGSYLSTIAEERDKYKKYLEEERNKKIEIEQNIYKCTSKEVAEMFLEDIEKSKHYISELKKTLKEWDSIINSISFAFDIWKNNQEEWKLYYYNH